MALNMLFSLYGWNKACPAGDPALSWRTGFAAGWLFKSQEYVQCIG
jgi:hypothetical protein